MLLSSVFSTNCFKPTFADIFCSYCYSFEILLVVLLFLNLLPYKFKPPGLIYYFYSCHCCCPFRIGRRTGWSRKGKGEREGEEGGRVRSLIHLSDFILGLSLSLVVFTPASYFSPSPLVCHFCVKSRLYTGFSFLLFRYLASFLGCTLCTPLLVRLVL